ncbi:MAG: helix-turn-helix transcriptional regulator [Flavobacteriaceae bacterium]|nr:helix-turn-helix transcriptional regulator [Flavobacteriaceae bacterium]
MNYSIGKKLKTLRKNKGLSQEEVADFVHISQSSYARIENGNSNSWSLHIDAFCDLFSITPEELLKQDNIIISQNQQGGTSSNSYIINQLSDKLIEQYEIRLKEKDELIAKLKQEIEEIRK